MGGDVNRILIDASVLFPDDESGNYPSSSISTAADTLLRRLSYSKIRTAIFYDAEFSASKVTLLEGMAKEKKFDYLILGLPSTDSIASEVMSWCSGGASTVLLISSQKEDNSQKLKNAGWVTVILRTSGEGSSNDIKYPSEGEDSSLFFISKLEELPFIICHLNKKANSLKCILVVGYVMKPSREIDFAKRGALPLSPTPNGLIFVPLSYELPVASQLHQLDGILHKATDEIVAIEMSASDSKIVYSNGMQELQRCIQRQADCCVIDQFENIYPVLDREKIQQILVGLESMCTKALHKIRGPHFLKIDNFEEPNLESKLLEAKLSLPNIIKPQVACGIADAHSMAIVFKVDDYRGLNVPLPAVIQEYVDHSCRLYKFYVLGEKIFYARKNSTPNAATLMRLSEENSLKPILFDSLKSLPVAKDESGGNEEIDLELVTNAANCLRKILNLTIFGFDVVIQDVTSDHVIVDLNYLPSFKEIPDDIAVPAFWEAIGGRIR